MHISWPTTLVLVALCVYIVIETVGSKTLEGFVIPPRADIGYGWGEEPGYTRNFHYKEAFVDLMGRGISVDFCRAVARDGDPDTLCIACALGTRDGMDTLEYRSRTKREGFRFSRDDYWHGRNYCRIVKDEETGHYYATCAVPGATGFKAAEIRDTDPPPAIQDLLRAYEGIMTWFRWRDDGEDYAENAAFERKGDVIVPSSSETVFRGLQLNRWTIGEQQVGTIPPPLHDYLRWGEKGTLTLDQTIAPRQIRAIACWVWWDTLEKGARILDCSNGDRKDQLWLGLEGGGYALPPPPSYTPPAAEMPSADRYAIGQLTVPAQPTLLRPVTQRYLDSAHPADATLAPQSARYVFEIWDEHQRLVRLESAMGSIVPGRWQHVVVTTTNNEAWWPVWEMYVDGELVSSFTDGRLSPAMMLSQNYIGQKMRGCLQDFRVYHTPMRPPRIKEAIAWSKGHLNPNP